MTKIQFLTLTLVGLGALTVQGQTAQPLYKLLDGDASKIPDCKRAKKDNLSCHLIDINSAFEVLQAKGPVSIPGTDVELKFKTDVGEDTKSWTFYYESEDGADSATFIISKKTLQETGNENGKGAPTYLAASIHVDDSVYEIVNHGRNRHLLIELDATNFEDGPPEENPGSGHGPPNSTHPNVPKRFQLLHDISSTLDKAIYYAQVKVYYTLEARAEFNSYQALVDHIKLAIAETNTGYCNSNVNIRISLRSVERSYVSDTSTNKLGDFTRSKGSYCMVRGGADAAVLLVSVANYRYCGQAWLNTVRSGKTFSVVRTDCATGYYSFGHELAHNLGAHHNIEVTSYVSGRYNYGKLFKNNDGTASGTRSIMAYNSQGYWRRINYYSLGPYNGGRGSSYENNRRVLNEAAYAFANVDRISC